jgi:three-Cys-motif partner protein
VFHGVAAKATDDWWREKYALLRGLAEEVGDLAPGQTYAKNGMWPVIKLVWMQYALSIYVPILRSFRGPSTFDSLHFIDFSAGNGLTTVKPAKRDPQVVAGSALLGAWWSDFDHHHFVEPDREQAGVLEQRLLRLLPREGFSIYHLPRAQAVGEIVQAIRARARTPHYLAFVDPEGFTEVTLPQLRPLFELSRGDFLFNFQHVSAKRHGPTAAAFLGRPEMEAALPRMEPGAIADVLREQLAAHGRPETVWIEVAKAESSYAYGVMYAAARTLGGNRWLENFRADVEKRMAGVDSAVLEDFLFGQKRLDRPRPKRLEDF